MAVSILCLCNLPLAAVHGQRSEPAPRLGTVLWPYRYSVFVTCRRLQFMASEASRRRYCAPFCVVVNCRRLQFMASEASRRRYWARSFVGWSEFAHVEPSGAHEGLARLQVARWTPHILTQNVDRLHQRAGATDVLEIHGTTHECASHRRPRVYACNAAAVGVCLQFMARRTSALLIASLAFLICCFFSPARGRHRRA